MCKRAFALKLAPCRNAVRPRFRGKCRRGGAIGILRKERGQLIRAVAWIDCLSTQLEYTPRRDKHQLKEIADRACRLLRKSISRLESLQAVARRRDRAAGD